MLKINRLKYISFFFLLILIVACSTKRNSFVNRNWHALNARDNTMYNGSIALQSGINELKAGYKDNFWELLTVERMQVVDESMLPGQKQKNANFERAETKATKAVQKHSMNIDGEEKNYQMDEAHLLLGKSRYYDQRFIPALEAFNYILYKYPKSDKIYEAKVWR
ncbi:MAG: gliding motility protein, partial [Flavobacterium sp.]